MTQAATTAAPLSSTVVPIEAGAHVTAATFLSGAPVLALGDGSVLFADLGEHGRMPAHPDATILAAAPLGDRYISGGDDGRVVATDMQGAMEVIAEEKGKWIDSLVVREDGSIAWSAGKQVRARDSKGQVKSWDAPSTVRGLAFTPKGYRLACSHYNGVSLWFPNATAKPEFLEYKGAHLDVTISPDGRFVVTTMQENALHGWKIVDRAHMKMTGYPAKTRSVSWSPDGFLLATSGAPACIVWPFDPKTGPTGKRPLECVPRNSLVSCVTFHPKAMVMAVGYDDGWILMCRISDMSEILVRAGDHEPNPVSALAFDRDGKRLLFGTEGGQAGLLNLFG